MFKIKNPLRELDTVAIRQHIKTIRITANGIFLTQKNGTVVEIK